MADDTSVENNFLFLDEFMIVCFLSSVFSLVVVLGFVWLGFGVICRNFMGDLLVFF